MARAQCRGERGPTLGSQPGVRYRDRVPGPGVLEALCAAVPTSVATQWSGSPGLGPAWDELWSRVADAWSQLQLDEQSFARWVGARMRDDDEPELLEGLDAEGLALAFACAQQHAGAAEAFQRRHGRDVELALDRLRLDSARRDDVRQIVLTKLLVGEGKLARFAGRGELAHFVRSVVVREAISQERKQSGREIPMDSLPEVAPPSTDPALDHAYVQAAYREPLREAFIEALRELSPDEQAVLRYRFVDGLTLEQLAAVLGVHRATGARRLAKIRHKLLRATRRSLAERLGISRSDVDSLVRVVRSNFELSLSGYL